MPVDSAKDNYSQLPAKYLSNFKPDDIPVAEDSENTKNQADSINNMKDTLMMATNDVNTSSSIMNGNKQLLDSHQISVRPKISERSGIQIKHVKQIEPNKWRRMIGFHVTGNELKSALFSKKQKLKKFRFAQAKKNINQVYSYFSLKILECEGSGQIVIGLSRRDFPSSSELGVALGSVGYDAGAGQILMPHEAFKEAPKFSKGDIIGCGVVYPSHYRRYADLSTDDSSDGMTDIVLTSLLNVNKKSMDFVQCVLGLKPSTRGSSSSSSEEDICFSQDVKPSEEADYYNENYTESRTEVEVYFTQNMQIIGKVSMCIPISGFYPTVQVSSPGDVRLQFDFS